MLLLIYYRHTINIYNPFTFNYCIKKSIDDNINFMKEIYIYNS
jgi:hypothetical protein